ncbi:hypothetical protein MNBD_ALPHA04-1058 [hydrothermal vent metagenome]|uniref:Periplasmic divalent cation tolerance protein CutA n=1 Tax=hydrothermal vent metagenome TaxID=652676 RepID=A0A3B0RU92_9ZZZZ
MSEKIALVYTLFGSTEEARRVAMILIEEKLIVCANHLAPVVSQYLWEGELVEDQEHPSLFKTSDSNVAATMARLKELHGYDTPAILSWLADRAEPAFDNWVKAQLQRT